MAAGGADPCANAREPPAREAAAAPTAQHNFNEFGFHAILLDGV
jgi:hypothetical protein